MLSHSLSVTPVMSQSCMHEMARRLILGLWSNLFSKQTPFESNFELHSDFIVETPIRPLSRSTVNTSSPHLRNRQRNAMPLNQRPSLLRIVSVHSWQVQRTSYKTTRQRVTWFFVIPLTKKNCLYSLIGSLMFSSCPCVMRSLIADHKDVLFGDFQNLLDFGKDKGLLLHTTFMNQSAILSCID